MTSLQVRYVPSLKDRPSLLMRPDRKNEIRICLILKVAAKLYSLGINQLQKTSNMKIIILDLYYKKDKQQQNTSTEIDTHPQHRIVTFSSSQDALGLGLSALW